VPYRISFIYDQVGDRSGGWSENFWNESGGLGAAIAVAEAVRGPAQEVHGRQTVMRAIRISEYDANLKATRVARTLYYTGNVNQSVGTAAESDYQTNAGGLELRSGDVYSIRSWIRGIWDSAVTVGGTWTPTAAYAPKLTAYYDALTLPANSFRLRVINKTNLGKPLQAITQLGQCTVNNHGWVSGNRIRISGTKGVAGLNKTWSIVVVDANNFTIHPWSIPVDPPVFTQLGEARLLATVLVPLTYVRVIRASKRDVGRPFGLLVGSHPRPRT